MMMKLANLCSQFYKGLMHNTTMTTMYSISQGGKISWFLRIVWESIEIRWCYKHWPYKTTSNRECFPANYSLVLQAQNFSTLNNSQYMVSHHFSNTLIEHVTLSSFIYSQVYSTKVDNCVQTKSMSIHTLLCDWISENHLYRHNDKYLEIYNCIIEF